MRKLCFGLIVLAIASGSLLSSPQSADARNQYFKQFSEKYKIAEAKEKKCGTCHGGEKGKDKKNLSEYAQALKAALGEKNVKDEEKIKSALTEVESKKGEKQEKTWGEMLKDGKLPPPAEDKKE